MVLADHGDGISSEDGGDDYEDGLSHGLLASLSLYGENRAYVQPTGKLRISGKSIEPADRTGGGHEGRKHRAGPKAQGQDIRPGLGEPHGQVGTGSGKQVARPRRTSLGQNALDPSLGVLGEQDYEKRDSISPTNLKQPRKGPEESDRMEKLNFQESQQEEEQGDELENVENEDEEPNVDRTEGTPIVVTNSSRGRTSDGKKSSRLLLAAAVAAVTAEEDEDEDYQRLSDFSSILADLRSCPDSLVGQTES
ncbi:unnamed protein product [Protopolystoma xenopodis]|uniref:Uncharacterized protein n=1 Tax=Protopolystoma xenopodis TaxID=117903 RepID=A0A448WJC7_9PLAT|nr:unnamed protein product [Protopolystoma xenopodis]